MRRFIYFITICTLSLAFTACSSTEEENTTTDEDTVDIEMQSKSLVGMINGTIYCLPSPYEIMNHISSLNLQYDRALPNSVLSYNTYESSFQKLLNMGIYGIDISYMSMYNQTSDALNYFATLKSLANQIELADVFDAETMERLENNMGNQDSLVRILTSKFQESDKLLKGENQKAEAALILTGCWIESLYLLTKIQKVAPNKGTVEKIAEHKLAAEAILNILRPYAEKSTEYKTLVTSIVDICYDFDGIDYRYTYKAPTTYEKRKITVINSETELIIHNEHIDLISNKIEKLRNYVVQ
ncbi:MAG: hypothetical protein MJ197_04440 [Bacteroidales bacterium]|nr:hypothetical protein [Bacteroidales bacterium]